MPAKAGIHGFLSTSRPFAKSQIPNRMIVMVKNAV
jgi:hypothetical protein